ncbi:MAG: HupE/UreJ family protein [Patiriisocius sp.]|uniref:HupE/UreJ family protein n=1 Tax=Patiriisocius sp. TaxID=2822396 RepID=UPI003EF227B2
MTDFWLYLKLGLEHILDWQGYDHLLFLVALSAAFTFATWRKLFFLVTAFTVGHSISLLLSHYKVFTIDSNWVECLIPITILIAGVFNLVKLQGKAKISNTWLLLATALIFGLIHGFGFAGYFNMILIEEENALQSLLYFALGVEFAQLIIVLGVLILTWFFQKQLKVSQKLWIAIVSIMVILLSLPMIYGSCLS